MWIKFLGTGTSHGIPVPGCQCRTCSSDDPRNNRTRSSVFIKMANRKILIDTAPELRLQLLQHKVGVPDLILFTHGHADHIMGFDDIRTFNWRNSKAIDCFCDIKTKNRLAEAFSYIFSAEIRGGGIPKANLKSIDKLYQGYKDIKPLKVFHGKNEIIGYRLGEMAYITDVSGIPKNTLEQLGNLELLVLGALRWTEHPTHFNIDEAITISKKIAASKTYFTHISHEVEHVSASKYLPKNISFAFDGLKLKI